MPQSDEELTEHCEYFLDKPIADVLAHMEAIHPDYSYLNAEANYAPHTAHKMFHLGEWNHRAIASHLIEGHGYSVQTVRQNPSPQLTIEHIRLHANEFADANESSWNHTHEPPRMWEPTIEPLDVVGRVIVVKTRRQDRGRWEFTEGLDNLRQAGANLVLFMDRLDTVEALDEGQMRGAGWVRLGALNAELAEQVTAWLDGQTS